MFQNLQPQLEKVLPFSKNVFIATALIKKYGYETIEKLLPEGCKRYYLVGINLPSDTSVFIKMKAIPKEKGGSRVYKGEHTYHPKVYLIEFQNGSFTAFIGSANTTNGGLSTNVEMSLKTDNQEECKALYDWFQDLYIHAGEITEKFIEAWQHTTKVISKRQSANRADVAALKLLLREGYPTSHMPALAGQFFKATDYQAYHQNNWENYSEPANQRRYEVWKRLKILHERLYPQFAEYGLSELHAHYHKASRISHYKYRKGWTNHVQRSIWLHYGYAQNEFPKSDTFGSHPRIQVILHDNDIGIWLVAGVPNGSLKERKRLKENLLDNPFFDELIYKTVRELGDIYWIDILTGEKSIANYPDAKTLKNFLLTDDPTNYFIIGRKFSVDDDALGDVVIAETVLLEFQRLYPLYLLFKHFS